MLPRTLPRLARSMLAERRVRFIASSTTTATSASSISCARSFSLTPARPFPRKDAQDKDSIDTSPTEYTKSGTDSDAAAQEQAAFDPSETRPDVERDVAGQGRDSQGKSNPLDVSPANPDVSKQTDASNKGADRSGNDAGQHQKRQSGSGSPQKGRSLGKST